MSTQRGNYKKGAQKHQNRTAFKNSLHDTSKRTKEINGIELHSLCERCKEVIEWKIKYKKYKPLTVPKKCTKCQQKTVKDAYYIVCIPCVSKLNICGKCGTEKELVLQSGPSASEQMSRDSQLKREIEMLPERKRRTFIRMQEQGILDTENHEDKNNDKISASEDFSDSDCDNDSDDNESLTVDKEIIHRVSKVTFTSVEVEPV